MAFLPMAFFSSDIFFHMAFLSLAFLRHTVWTVSNATVHTLGVERELSTWILDLFLLMEVHGEKCL